ncbi:hypothetical protein BLOT_010725 [Blomia tropicalis]|nr:hypothetical protein BLOT_010725 [Blomia tropicalis]
MKSSILVHILCVKALFSADTVYVYYDSEFLYSPIKWEMEAINWPCLGLHITRTQVNNDISIHVCTIMKLDISTMFLFYGFLMF